MVKMKQRETQFTERERELIAYIAGGYKDEETAEKMGIQTQTIRGMVNVILKRLNLINRPQLVCFAIKNKII